MSLDWLTVDLTSPLDLCAIAIFLYIIWKTFICRFVFREPPAVSPYASHLPPLKQQDMTLQQLKEYGPDREDGRILTAVDGKIFDVTRAKHLYGKDGPYGLFAGRDASRGLATFDASEKAIRDTHDDLADLDAGEMDQMKEWAAQFQERYPVVGRLLKPGQRPEIYEETDDETDEKQSDKKEE